MVSFTHLIPITASLTKNAAFPTPCSLSASRLSANAFDEVMRSILFVAFVAVSLLDPKLSSPDSTVDCENTRDVVSVGIMLFLIQTTSRFPANTRGFSSAPMIGSGSLGSMARIR